MREGVIAVFAFHQDLGLPVDVMPLLVGVEGFSKLNFSLALMASSSYFLRCLANVSPPVPAIPLLSPVNISWWIRRFFPLFPLQRGRNPQQEKSERNLRKEWGW